jgi:glycosyltransferase involved in cell wall biosynthesis
MNAQQFNIERMYGDPSNVPPSISPVAPGQQRPLWSVMIPAYNCARFLGQTLESVLAQDPGPEQMQIQVVDDCSTQDDPQQVVREVGQGRVEYYRQPENVGINPNFNTCIARSKGHLVHILHGDDYVLPDFYTRVAKAAAEHPDLAAFFVRCMVIDEENALMSLSGRIRSLESPTRDVKELYYWNSILTPGAVIRRSFYEQYGGFILNLIHVADWEMWARAIQLSGGLMLNEMLAAYRSFTANHTSQMTRSGENLRDFLRLAEIWAHRHDDFRYRRFVRNVSKKALRQSKRFAEIGLPEAAAANLQVWRETTSRYRQFRIQAREWKRKVLRASVFR